MQGTAGLGVGDTEREEWDIVFRKLIVYFGGHEEPDTRYFGGHEKADTRPPGFRKGDGKCWWA